MVKLDALNDNKNQQKVTYICIAILLMFFLCQLPHGLWLAKSSFSLSGIMFQDVPNALETEWQKCKSNIDNDLVFKIPQGVC